MIFEKCTVVLAQKIAPLTHLFIDPRKSAQYASATVYIEGRDAGAIVPGADRERSSTDSMHSLNSRRTWRLFGEDVFDNRDDAMSQNPSQQPSDV